VVWEDGSREAPSYPMCGPARAYRETVSLTRESTATWMLNESTSVAATPSLTYRCATYSFIVSVYREIRDTCLNHSQTS
jgi:hypothetical protein